MSKIYIGIDNGVTGSIGIIDTSGYTLIKTPVKKELSYTKKKQYITRIDIDAFTKILKVYKDKNCIVLLERPMVNPGRFKATVSALRSLEATIIVLEMLCLSYDYIDSKEWQKRLLPAGIKGTAALKKASLNKGKQLFPKAKCQNDCDGLLIAYYSQLTNR